MAELRRRTFISAVLGYGAFMIPHMMPQLTPRDTMRPNPVRSRKPCFAGLVSAASPEAATAGAEILSLGGNAIDAAVAIAFALGVTEPAGSGLGGQTKILVHPPGGRPFVIDGTSVAPLHLPQRQMRAKRLHGHRATTVPSTVRTLAYAWQHYGSGKLMWDQLLTPAIGYAEDGFRLGRFRHRVLCRAAPRLRVHSPTARLFLDADGAVPERGRVVRQPLLARTLTRLAHAGAEDFYVGEIARQIVADMTVHHGWITRDDLKQFPPPTVQLALQGSYRGWEVYTLPPPCSGGWTVLHILSLLEHVDPQELQRHHPLRLFRLAEALRLGHLHRRQLAFIASPPRGAARTPPQPRRLESPEAGETTHFSLVDAQGMGVGVTQSINSLFGAHVAHPELGFLYNDYMKEFVLNAPQHPFALRPQGVPYSSMSATTLAADGEMRMVLGSPGSARIISAVVQVISNWLDTSLPIRKAVAAPRLHVIPEGRRAALHIEPKLRSAALAQAFKRRRFSVRQAKSGGRHRGLHWYFGGVHAVAMEANRWHGAADPRRDGVVLEARRPPPLAAP